MTTSELTEATHREHVKASHARANLYDALMELRERRATEAAPSPQPGPRLVWELAAPARGFYTAHAGPMPICLFAYGDGRRFDLRFGNCSRETTFTADGPLAAQVEAEHRLAEHAAAILAALNGTGAPTAVTALREIAAAWRKEAALNAAAPPAPMTDDRSFGGFFELSDEPLLVESEDPAPAMTLERAVEVLNERRHNHCDDWTIRAAGHLVESEQGMDALTPFEVIAIATAYERDAPSSAQEGDRDDA